MKKSGPRCVHCGRLLRSEASIARGAGRDCIRKNRGVNPGLQASPIDESITTSKVMRRMEQAATNMATEFQKTVGHLAAVGTAPPLSAQDYALIDQSS